MLISKKKFTILFIVGLSIPVILTVAYVCKFRTSNLSGSPEHWGQFGDYFNMVFNLAGTTAVCILSYMVYKSQIDRDSWEKSILQLNDTPILIFSADNNIYDKCINVGKGAAHNVIIGKLSFRKTWDVIKAYSIPANGYIQITWENDPEELYAYYEDIYGKEYLVKCKDDVNSQLINGKTEKVTPSNLSTVRSLKQSAKRHPRVSLKMLGS